MTMLRNLTAIAIASAGFALASAAPAAAQPGAFDSSFGGSGIVTTSQRLFGVAVQGNGEVVVAGQTGGSVFVERFTTSGATDGSYTGPGGVARAVAIQPDGKIVIAGTSGGSMFAERLTSGLVPDTSFGSGGIATALAGTGAVANAVALGSNGQIVAAGAVGSPPSFAVAEFTSTGSATAQVYGFGGYASAGGVAVQPNGKIVIVGRRTPSQVTDAVIARLNPDGSLDSSFAGSGATIFDYPGSGSTAFGGVTLASNGEILVDGQAQLGTGALAIFMRYTNTGGVDTSFGSGGVTAVPAQGGLSSNPGGSVGAYGIGVSGPSGNIVGAGPFQFGAAEVDAAAWAVGPNGAPDSSFGNGGVQRGPGGLGHNYEACGLAVAPDGSPDAGEIVTVGDQPNSPDYVPCSSTGGGGYVASYAGYGPPPPPPPPQPQGSAPTVSTGAATSVTTASATVSGTVNPNEQSTTYHFDYGTSTSYGSSTGEANAGSGATAMSVSADLTGLSPGTTYHYRLVAKNATGTSTGSDATFTTAAASSPPSATTGSASGVGEVSATVRGIVNPAGQLTTYQFQFGPTKSYGSSSSSATITGSTPVNVSASLMGLKPGTTYHYRVVASNPGGMSFGGDRTFTTAPPMRSRLHGVKSSYRLAGVLKNGLTIRIGCSQPCSITGQLTISAATARSLGLGSRTLTIASGKGSLVRAGITSLVLHISRAAYRSALAGHRNVPVTLQTVSRPTGGGPAVTNTKGITLNG